MVVNFFGKRGTGKTTAIRGQVRFCKAPVFVLDVLGNFDEPHMSAVSPPVDVLVVSSSAEALSYIADHEARDWKPVVVRTSDPTADAEYLVTATMHTQGGTLVIDEIDSIDRTKARCFDQFVRYGRNWGGDLLTGCRRPAEIPRNLTAAADKFYCYGTHEPRDVEYFWELFGEEAQRLTQLPKYHGLFLDYHNGLRGEFCVDPGGQLFHTREERLV